MNNEQRAINQSRIRQILHVDMDAFYASVEQLDNPQIRGKPVIVGGNPKGRSVVSSASYEARKFGVHSAMPMARAIKLCPQAVILPVRMERYVQLSREIHAIFERYSPLVESVSLDEAFLDVTGSTGLFGTAEKIGLAIKKAIKSSIGLTASVGLAPNKFLAKLASDLEKPDGFVIITEQNKQSILDPLPVSRIWGVGEVTAQALQSRGIKTIAQLRETTLQYLTSIVGNQAQQILQLAKGIDEREVEPFRQTKSISSEKTFDRDIQDEQILLGVLLNQVEEVAQRLRAVRLKAATITLKLRYGNFRTITRSKTLDRATNTTMTLWQVAKAIFQKWQRDSAPALIFDKKMRGWEPNESVAALRLIGFGASGLVEETGGQQLFPDLTEEKHKRLDKAFDEIRNRYGEDAVRYGH